MMSDTGSPCSKCGALHEHAQELTDGKGFPAEGDFAMCIICAHVMVYVGMGLLAREATPKESLEFNARYHDVRKQLLEFIQTHKN